VGTRLADPDLTRLLATVCAEAGVAAPVPDPPPGLEVVRRRAPDGTAYLFLLNHADAEVGLDLAGTDLLTGTHHDAVRVPGGGVVVLATAG
jgi:beta-galactosidase